jgi:hypothetical protein
MTDYGWESVTPVQHGEPELNALRIKADALWDDYNEKCDDLIEKGKYGELHHLLKLALDAQHFYEETYKKFHGVA